MSNEVLILLFTGGLFLLALLAFIVLFIDKTLLSLQHVLMQIHIGTL